jgi:hypothetical protein
MGASRHAEPGKLAGIALTLRIQEKDIRDLVQDFADFVARTREP